MEEKVVAVAPLVILNPREGDEVETLLLEGTGEAGARVFIRTNIPYPPGQNLTTWVDNQGHWRFSPTTPEFDAPLQQAWVSAFQMPHKTSDPEQTINFKKLLTRPKITQPLAGGSLPAQEQRITGTGFNMNTQIVIELTKIAPPALTYHANATPDGAGWWRANPKWSLMPGSYALKCKQIHEDHTSRWSDDLLVVVE